MLESPFQLLVQWKVGTLTLKKEEIKGSYLEN